MSDIGAIRLFCHLGGGGGAISVLYRPMIQWLSDVNFCIQMKKLIKTPIIETSKAVICLSSAQQF